MFKKTKTDYPTSEKIGDFFIGVFGCLLALIIAVIVGIFVTNMFPIFGGSSALYTVSILYLLVVGAICYSAHKGGKRYVIIGVAAFFVVPLLIFGSCMMAFGNI